MKLKAEWTDDCQGKKSYDASLLRLRSRYWPRGGGFSLFNTGSLVWQENEARPEIKPSACARIMMQEEILIEADFEGETEAEVKALAEKWAQEQFDKIGQALRGSPERTVVTCVYCGHEYPDGTPTHKAELLTEHIKVCDKHPMRQLEERVARFRAILFPGMTALAQSGERVEMLERFDHFLAGGT